MAEPAQHDDLTISLTSLIGELGIAWQKLSIYQVGHPARDHAVGRAHAVLMGLIAPAGSLSIGVSRDGLLGPEEKLATGAAARLANALYLREVALIRFEEGIEAREIEQLLSLLPRQGIYQGDRALGDELAELGVRHVVVESVDFTGVVATESLDDQAPESRSESLWDRIIQRLLRNETLSAARTTLMAPGAGSLSKVVAAVNRLMERYGAEPREASEADEPLTQTEVLDALAGLIGRAVGDQTLEAGDPEAERSTARHVTELLGALPEGLRDGILDTAVRQVAQRDDAPQGLRSLAGAVSAAQMVASLRRLRGEKVSFSPRVVALLQSLILEAAPGSLGSEQLKDPEELAEDLRRVFSDEDVDRAGQGAASADRLFLDLRHHVPIHARFADLEPYLDSLTQDRETVLLSITLTDLLRQPWFGADELDRIVSRQRQTFRSILAGGRFATATGMVVAVRDLAATADEPSVQEAADRCLEAFRQGETLATIVDTFGEMGAFPLESFQRLIELLGPKSVRQLLLVLGDEPTRARRRRIFDLLATLGPAVAPSAAALLDDPRWYMPRNILSLLRRVGAEIDFKVLFKGLDHSDYRVRLEAVKCIPEVKGGISADLVERLLDDPDARVSEAAASTFGRARIEAASGPLVRLLQRADPLGRQKGLRLKALRALGDLGDPAVLPQISQFFRSWFAVVTHEERHAAFETLRFYPASARSPWLKKGRRAPDAKVREICRRLEAAESRPIRGS